MKIIVLLVGVVVSVPGLAQVYKCKDGATTIFSAQPCSPSAQPVDVRPASGASRAVPAPDAGPARAAGEGVSPAERMRRQAESMQLEREMKEAQAARDKLVRDRDDELEVLRRKKVLANNNLAGATWLQSISAEMQVVSDNYAARINDADSALARYKAKLGAR